MNYDQIIDVRLLAPTSTCIAILVTVCLWVLNQRRKQISFRIIFQDAFTQAQAAVRDRLGIALDDEAARSAGLSVVQIVNSGHLAVVPSDYHSPLTISAGPGARILFADIISTAPGDLDERCRTAHGGRRSLIDAVRGSEVVLSPVLLNDGDSITVQMVVEDLRGGVKVVGHINGVRRIAPWRPSTFVPTVLTNLGALIMVCSLLLVEPPAVLRFGWSEALPTILFFLLGYTLLSAGIYGRRTALRTDVECVL